MSLATAQNSATTQADLWNARAVDWADHQEPQLHEIHTAVLASVPALAGRRLLDVGCGAGTLLRRAGKYGAVVSGLDADPELVTIAHRRLPDADIRVGDLERLPFERETFDIVTGINSVPDAADPVAALAEARRVLHPSGHVVVVTWGRPECSDAAAHLAAVEPLLPSIGQILPHPFALAKPMMLTRLVEAVGFINAREHQVASTWEYADQTELLRGLLSTGPMVRAAAHSGSHAVSQAVLRAVAPYRDGVGGYRLRNVFRYVVAETPSRPAPAFRAAATVSAA